MRLLSPRALRTGRTEKPVFDLHESIASFTLSGYESLWEVFAARRWCCSRYRRKSKGGARKIMKISQRKCVFVSLLRNKRGWRSDNFCKYSWHGNRRWTKSTHNLGRFQKNVFTLFYCWSAEQRIIDVKNLLKF